MILSEKKLLSEGSLEERKVTLDLFADFRKKIVTLAEEKFADSSRIVKSLMSSRKGSTEEKPEVLSFETFHSCVKHN